MRELDVILADIRQANTKSDIGWLHSLIEELQAMSDDRATVHLHMTHGLVARLEGRYQESIEWYMRALEIYTHQNDGLGIANIDIKLGATFASMSDHHRAFDHYERARAYFQTHNVQRGLATALGNIGILYYDQSDYATAFEYFNRELAIHEEMGNDAEIARVTSNIGNVYHWFGDHPKSLACHTKSAEINRAIGNLYRLAYSLGGIGSVYQSMNDFEIAIRYFQEVLQIRESLGLPAHLAETKAILARCYHFSGQQELAISSAREAIEISAKLGARLQYVKYQLNYVSMLIELDRIDEARSCIAEIGDTSDLAGANLFSLHSSLAAIAKHEGDLDSEFAECMIMTDLAQRLKVRSFEATAYKGLREIARKRGDLEGYIRYNDLHTKIIEEETGANAKAKIAVQETERMLERERREKERHRELLYSTLPPSIADRVLRGEQVNDSFEHACVMFVDMVGFTTMTSEMHPDDVVRMLSDIFSQIDAIVARYNVMKIKTIGDAYMAVAFPSESSISEQRMAEAATEILQAASNITSPTGSKLSVRIGIHSGPVTAGVIGSERLQYDVWGDTVNVASRMESTGEAGRIHISSTFASCIKHPASNHAWNTEPRGEIDIKGKGTMSTFWLSVQEPS